MLSKEQASTIAQDLLDQAEAARIERLNAAVAPIGRYWSCPEFNLLAQHQRGDIVHQAKANVRAQSAWLLYCFIGLMIPFVFWLDRSPMHQADVAWLPVLVLPVCWLVWLLRVRREVRKLAAEMLPSWSASDAATSL